MHRNLTPIAAVVLALIGASAVAWAQPGPPPPVAYWPMDDGAGATARDASGKGHDLSLTSPAWVDGAVGKALCFDGRTTAAVTPSAPDLRPTKAVTVEAWVRVDELPANAEGIGIVSAGNSYLLRISGTTPSFHIFTTQWGPVMAEGSLRTARWYHLVGTYDGREMRIYVNGEPSGARERTGDINVSTDRLVLGRQVSPLIGCVDEVRIYPAALSPEQVAAAFSQSRARLAAGVTPGTLMEPFEDLFGLTRHNPAPQPTLDHLAPADLTFCVITDTHIGTREEEQRYCHNWRVEETIRQINGLRPDFVVNCGDIITAFPFHEQYEGQCRNAVEVLKGFTVPVHLAPGNHDVGNQRNMRVWDDQWLGRVKITLEDMLVSRPRLDVYRRYFGKDFYSFEQGGCCFIILNDQLCNSGLEAEQEQETWLAAELEKGRAARATFVFAHNPLFWNRPDEPGPKNYEPVLEPARGRLLALLRRYPGTVFYAGHTHFDITNDYDGLHLRTINSTTFNRNYRGAEQGIPGDAEVYNPYKVGFLVVRVRGREPHESWVPLYWQVGAPPPELAELAAGRLVGRPSTEAAQGILGIATMPPPSFSYGADGRETVNDHRWRLVEALGSQWLRLARLPANDEEWTALDRGLTLGRPRAVKLAVPLPADEAPMAEAWSRLKKHAAALDAVVVANGAAADPNAPLSSWRTEGTPADWAAACDRARALAGPAARIVVSRLPLLGPNAVEALGAAAAALAGKADGLAVWMSVQEAPEESILRALLEAASAVRDHGLDLWLDTASWQTVDEPLRSAYFLRLLALCQWQHVPVFWWIGSSAGGLLDGRWDPTPLHYAAQSWQAVVDPPATALEAKMSADQIEIRWRDARGRRYLVWWRPSGDFSVGPTHTGIEVPAGALVADPLHGRLLTRPASGRLPVCSWPLVARAD